MNNIVIRKTKIDDAEKFVKFNNAIQRETYANIFPQRAFDDMDAESDERIKKFKESDINKNNHVGFVAFDGDTLIGYAEGSLEHDYEHFAKQGFSEFAIYISPTHQHIGLGKKFFDMVTQELRDKGSKKLAFGVLAINTKARKAYEKWGCKLDDYSAPLKRFGNEYPEVFYTYDLGVQTHCATLRQVWS